MFCTKCGNQIAEGNRFCSKCGTPVANIPTPAGNGYNPVMNQGVAPAGNTGYNPAMNQGYAPAGNAGYNPAMNQGYAPAGNAGYNPAMNQGYAPAGNTGFNQGFNQGMNNGFGGNMMNQTANSASQFMAYSAEDEDEEKTEMFDSTPVAPVAETAPVVEEDEEKTEMLEAAPVVSPDDVTAPAVSGDNDMFSNEPIGFDDDNDMFSSKPIGFDEPIAPAAPVVEEVEETVEEPAEEVEETVEETAEEIEEDEEKTEMLEAASVAEKEEAVEEVVEEPAEEVEETVEEAAEEIEEDEEKTEMLEAASVAEKEEAVEETVEEAAEEATENLADDVEEDQTEENIEATPIGVQPVKVETINVQPSFGTAGFDAAANAAQTPYNAPAFDQAPVYNPQPAFNAEPGFTAVPQDNAPAAPKKKKHTGLKIFLLLIVLILLIGGGIVGFLFYSQAKREKDYENHLKNAQKYIDDLEYELAVAELDEAIKIEGQDNRAKDLMVTTYDDWAVYVVEEDADYAHATEILDEGFAKTEDEDLKDTMVDVYIEWTDFVLEDEDYEKAIDILEEGIEKTDSDELQDKLDEVEEEKKAYDEQQEWLGTLSGVFTEVAKYCSEDDYDGLFDYMTTDEYAEFIDNLDKLDKTTDVDTDYGNVGIYIIDSKNYGNYMLYYGDYVSGKRDGYGDWFGYYDGNNYHAAGYWDNDAPNGPQTVREWSTQLDSSVVYRVIEGSTSDGLWNGAVDWCFELGSETEVFPCNFENGYVVKLRETSNGYTVSDGTGSGTMYFTYEEAEETHGIIGFDEAGKN